MPVNRETALENLKKAAIKQKEKQAKDKQRVADYIKLYGNRGAAIIGEFLKMPAKTVNRYKKELGIPLLYNNSNTDKSHFKELYQHRQQIIEGLRDSHVRASRLLTMEWSKRNAEAIREEL
jgi:phage head maturation protease